MSAPIKPDGRNLVKLCANIAYQQGVFANRKIDLDPAHAKQWVAVRDCALAIAKTIEAIKI